MLLLWAEILLNIFINNFSLLQISVAESSYFSWNIYRVTRMSSTKLQLLYKNLGNKWIIFLQVSSFTSYSYILKKGSPVLPRYPNTYTKGKVVLTNQVFVNMETCRTQKYITSHICKMEFYHSWTQNEDRDNQIPLMHLFKPCGPHISCTNICHILPWHCQLLCSNVQTESGILQSWLCGISHQSATVIR